MVRGFELKRLSNNMQVSLEKEQWMLKKTAPVLDGSEQFLNEQS